MKTFLICLSTSLILICLSTRSLLSQKTSNSLCSQFCKTFRLSFKVFFHPPKLQETIFSLVAKQKGSERKTVSGGQKNFATIHAQEERKHTKLHSLYGNDLFAKSAGKIVLSAGRSSRGILCLFKKRKNFHGLFVFHGKTALRAALNCTNVVSCLVLRLDKRLGNVCLEENFNSRREKSFQWKKDLMSITFSANDVFAQQALLLLNYRILLSDGESVKNLLNLRSILW